MTSLAHLLPGVEWLPAIVLYDAVGNLAGLICVIAGLVSRESIIARRDGIAVIIAALVLAPIFDWLSHGLSSQGRLMLASFILLGIVALVLSFRKQPSASACRKCGYDLRGSAASARCPECGSSFAPIRFGDKTGHT